MFQNLTELCGQDPGRDPPTESKLAEMRAALADELGIARTEVDAHHPSSPWRHRLVKGVQAECNDPDTHIATWLEEGAPMGLEAEIKPGHLFPKVEGPPLGPQPARDL